MKKQIFLIICITISSLLTSCEYHLGGANTFNATSDTEEGKSAIKQFNIRYVSPDVYGVLYTDFYRKEGVFAYNVYEENGKVYYDELGKDEVAKWGLKKDFNWWQRYGGWIAIPLFFGIGFLYYAYLYEIKI